jgi:diaminopimelate epimerase
VAVQTLGGIKLVEVITDDEGSFASARVDMGEPVLDAARIPTTLPGEPVVDAPATTAAGDVSVTCVSMGNPHAIVWVDDVDEAPVTTLGPLVETADVFPRKTNVEFAQVTAPDRIRLRVWERGVGETLACGTGACATLVAASLTGRTGRRATVELPGGELDIEWAGNNHVWMTGPAQNVFEGAWVIPDEE